MVRSSGFGSITSDICPIQARFHYGFSILCLNLPLPISRRLILQQARRQTNCRPSTACKFMVSCSFHSPPGVLFTFPSRYFSLSVIQEYLALRGGPRRFTRNYTCSMLLGILFWLLQFSITRLSLSMVRYSNLIHLIVAFNQFITIPLPLILSLGFSPFRSPLLRESRFCFLFL